jgi:hypothetical protein
MVELADSEALWGVIDRTFADGQVPPEAPLGREPSRDPLACAHEWEVITVEQTRRWLEKEAPQRDRLSRRVNGRL